MVGKIDGDQERALSSRFGVSSYPTFYVVDGYAVYEFEKPRSKQQLVDFATRYQDPDYDVQPIPWYSSPMGPLGLAQGSMIATGTKVADAFEYLQDALDLSPMMAGALLLGGTFIGCFVTIVFWAVVLTPAGPKKQKRD